MKVMLLNENVKHHLFKSNFDIEFFLLILDFSMFLLLISTTFHDSHAIQMAPHRQM